MLAMISDTVRASDRSWPWHQTPHKMGEAKTSTVRSRPSQGYGMLSKAVRAPFPCSEHITRASQVLSVLPLERYSPHLHRWHRKHCSVTSTKHLDKSEVTWDHNRQFLFPQRVGESWKKNCSFITAPQSPQHVIVTETGVLTVLSGYHPTLLSFSNQFNSIFVAKFCTHLLWFITSYLNIKARGNPLQCLHNL